MDEEPKRALSFDEGAKKRDERFLQTLKPQLNNRLISIQAYKTKLHEEIEKMHNTKPDLASWEALHRKIDALISHEDVGKSLQASGDIAKIEAYLKLDYRNLK